VVETLQKLTLSKSPKNIKNSKKIENFIDKWKNFIIFFFSRKPQRLKENEVNKVCFLVDSLSFGMLSLRQIKFVIKKN
jgi:hypothetical protein